MPRKKKPNVEIVPESQAALVPKAPAANFQAVLDQMVRDRVAEALAEGDVSLMEPDFLPREIAIEIVAQQTLFHRCKFRLYFEKWGCRTCGKKTVAHSGRGYCHHCHVLIHQRLQQIKRDWDKAHSDKEIDRQIARISSRVRSAQTFLGEGKK